MKNYNIWEYIVIRIQYSHINVWHLLNVRLLRCCPQERKRNKIANMRVDVAVLFRVLNAHESWLQKPVVLLICRMSLKKCYLCLKNKKKEKNVTEVLKIEKKITCINRWINVGWKWFAIARAKRLKTMIKKWSYRLFALCFSRWGYGTSERQQKRGDCTTRLAKKSLCTSFSRSLLF